MSRIITSDLEKEFKSALYKNSSKSFLGTNSNLVNKKDLPRNVQRKMTRAAVADVKMTAPSFYHPLFQATNMMLPRDRRERNEWCRHFYMFEPIVGSALDLHTEFPISDFNNVCYDKAIKDFFDYMAFEKLDLIGLLLDIGLEYWKIGDVFPFGQLNEAEGMWEKFTILNPDYIDIQASVLAEDPIIELIPDSEIQTIVNGGPGGEFGEIYSQIPDEVLQQVKMGNNIRLDNRLVSHIAHKAAHYETWGLPLLMRCFKTLIYKDKLRQAQNAIADRHIMPIKVAKLGTPGEPYPDQDQVDDFREMLMSCSDDPSSFLVYHYGVQFDYIGSSGKILPLNQEFEFIQHELMNGLCINQAMLNGEGPTYANAQVGYDTLAKRYMAYRLRLESWIKRKVYKPIAEIQGFYKPKDGTIATKYLSSKEQVRLAAKKEMELIIPDITWQQQNLTSDQSAMNFIQNLQQKGLVSMSTVLPILGLDPETEKKNLEEERGTVFDINAPKTGPLPSEGVSLDINPGTHPSAPSASDGEKPKKQAPPTPPPGGKSSPEDFGFPKKQSLNDFFQKNGEQEKKVSTVHRSTVTIRKQGKNQL